MDTPGLPAKIDPDALTTVLDGRWAELRRAVRAQMAVEGFQDAFAIPEQYLAAPMLCD